MALVKMVSFIDRWVFNSLSHVHSGDSRKIWCSIRDHGFDAREGYGQLPCHPGRVCAACARHGDTSECARRGERVQQGDRRELNERIQRPEGYQRKEYNDLRGQRTYI